MFRRSLLLVCAMSVGCFSESSGEVLEELSWSGWDSPDVHANEEAANAAVARAVEEAPVPVPAKRVLRGAVQPTAHKVEKKAPKVAFKGAGADVSDDIDLGALKGSASAKAATTRRATTRRDAVEAPKLERGKGAGAVSLAPSGAAASGTASLSSIGGATVRRGLSADQIKEVALASMGQVRACYERALKSAPQLRGRVVVDWKVAPSGQVTRASINRDDIGDAGLQSCIIETVKAWTFPEAGKSTPVSFPFTLKPG